MFNIGPSNLAQMFSKFGGQGGFNPAGNQSNGMPFRTPMNGGFAGPINDFPQRRGGMFPRPMPLPQGQTMPDMPIGHSGQMFPGGGPIGSWGNDAEMRGRMGYNMGGGMSNPDRNAPPIDTPLPSFISRMGGGMRRMF